MILLLAMGTVALYLHREKQTLAKRIAAVVSKQAYFFYAEQFGPSVADEINLLDHQVLLGFITVTEYNDRVATLLQPYLDIEYDQTHD